jgi:hypothetical protein
MEFVFSLVSALRELRDYRDIYARIDGSKSFATYSALSDKPFYKVLDNAEKQFKDFELDAALDRCRR